MSEEIKLVNKSGLAKASGLSRQRIGQCAKEGKIKFDENGLINLREALEELKINTDQSKQRNKKTDDEVEDVDLDIQTINLYELQDEDFLIATNNFNFNQIKIKIEQAKLLKEKRILDQQMGRLVLKSSVEKVASESAVTLRSELLKIPAKFAKELAFMDDELEIENLLELEIQRALDQFINDVYDSDFQ